MNLIKHLGCVALRLYVGCTFRDSFKRSSRKGGGGNQRLHSHLHTNPKEDLMNLVLVSTITCEMIPGILE